MYILVADSTLLESAEKMLKNSIIIILFEHYFYQKSPVFFYLFIYLFIYYTYIGYSKGYYKNSIESNKKK